MNHGLSWRIPEEQKTEDGEGWQSEEDIMESSAPVSSQNVNLDDCIDKGFVDQIEYLKQCLTVMKKEREISFKGKYLN